MQPIIAQPAPAKMAPVQAQPQPAMEMSEDYRGEGTCSELTWNIDITGSPASGQAHGQQECAHGHKASRIRGGGAGKVCNEQIRADSCH